MSEVFGCWINGEIFCFRDLCFEEGMKREKRRGVSEAFVFMFLLFFGLGIWRFVLLL